MKPKVLSTAILAIFLSTPVMADDSILDQQSEMAQLLLNFDTDGDGFISRDEMTEAKITEFNEGDSDASGYLSWAEFKALAANKADDHDSSMFGVMDTDESGDVTSAEFSAVFADRSTQQAAAVFDIAAGDDALMSLEELTAMQSTNIGKQMWKYSEMDLDADGQLSVDEYTEMPPHRAERNNSGERSEERRGRDGRPPRR